MGYCHMFTMFNDGSMRATCNGMQTVTLQLVASSSSQAASGTPPKPAIYRVSKCYLSINQRKTVDLSGNL